MLPDNSEGLRTVHADRRRTITWSSAAMSSFGRYEGPNPKF
ncbi:hypothetical protein [Bradyrhizobium sp. MOS003]|nr:hypothetical protein [Bradyrhizobium sp. MOS003]